MVHRSSRLATLLVLCLVVFGWAWASPVGGHTPPVAVTNNLTSPGVTEDTSLTAAVPSGERQPVEMVVSFAEYLMPDVVKVNVTRE
jgi:hypothetical protein